jgi:hypothetical protein
MTDDNLKIWPFMYVFHLISEKLLRKLNKELKFRCHQYTVSKRNRNIKDELGDKTAQSASFKSQPSGFEGGGSGN